MSALSFAQIALAAFVASGCARDSTLAPGRGALNPLVRNWKIPMPGGMGFPIYTDLATTAARVVFVASNRSLVSVKRQDGELQWTAPGSFSSANNVLVSGDVVAVATDTVAAFDITSGVPRWRYWAGSSASNCTPSATATAMVVCTQDWKIVALDPESGTVKWIRELRDSLGGIPTVVGTTISGDTVYAAVKQRYSATNGFTVGLFFAISMTDGRLLRVFRDGNYTDFSGYVGTPTVVGPLLVIPHLLANKLTAINRFTGQVAWRVNGDEGWAGFEAVPTVVDGVLYAASADRRVYAVDAVSGAVRWKSDILEGSQNIAVACGSLVLTWSGVNLRILDRSNGKYLGWVLDEITDDTQRFSSNPAVDGSDLFVRSVREVRKYACP